MDFSIPPNKQGDWQTIAAQEAAERAALEAQQLARRLPWFREEMCIQKGFYDHLGWIGTCFLEAFNKAAAPDEFDMHLGYGTRAVLNTHHVTKGFQRQIIFGRHVAEDSNRLAIFWAMTHEGTHLANQYDRIPATHATPFNPHARVVLCPRDAMILNVLMERQAFAMELLMEDLRQDVMAGRLVPADIPASLQLQEKLRMYAARIDTRTRWGTEEMFLSHYWSSTLNAYDDRGRIAHIKNNNISFARLGLTDLRLLNDCFGMKTFGDGDDDLVQLLQAEFAPEQQARLDRINGVLGIGAEDNLPLLADALAAHGSSPERFLHISAGLDRVLPPMAAPYP